MHAQAEINEDYDGIESTSGFLKDQTKKDDNLKEIKKYLLGSLSIESKNKKKVLKMKDIVEVRCQTYNALDSSVEIFMKNNKSFYFVLYEEQMRKLFIEKLKIIRRTNKSAYFF